MKRAWPVVLVLLASCAAPQKASPGAAPAASPPREDGAGAESADKDVDGVAAPAAVPQTAPAGSAGETPAAPGTKATVAPNDTIGKAQVAFEEASGVFAAATDCASLCKALASMTNATSRLCALTEAGSSVDRKRCTDARAKLDGAEAKVKATCGGC